MEEAPLRDLRDIAWGERTLDAGISTLHLDDNRVIAGDWDGGITIDIIDSAEKAEKIILLSGDGDFDLLVQKVIDKYGCIVDIYGVKELTADSLIDSATNFHSISNDFLV